MARVALVIALILSGAGDLTGQAVQDPMAAQLQSAAERSPVELFFEHQRELDLSPDQLERIAEIQDRTRAQNRALVGPALRRWAEAPDPAPGARMDRRGRIVEFRELMRTVRQHHTAARSEAFGLLTADQQARLNAIIQARSTGGGTGRAP